MLFSTGFGSTGWSHSASRYIQPAPDPWAKTAPYAYFVEREPYGNLDQNRCPYGAILNHQTMVINSGHNHQGLLTIDSITDVPFQRGSRATIKISDFPLKILT